VYLVAISMTEDIPVLREALTLTFSRPEGWFDYFKATLNRPSLRTARIDIVAPSASLALKDSVTSNVSNNEIQILIPRPNGRPL
jgi:hypothetical protein